MAMALVVAVALSGAACHSKHGEPEFAGPGVPVYPNAVPLRERTVQREPNHEFYVLAFKSADSYQAVVRWYAARLPREVQIARDDRRGRATFALFGRRDVRSVHVRAVPNGVIIELTRNLKR